MSNSWKKPEMSVYACLRRLFIGSGRLNACCPGRCECSFRVCMLNVREFIFTGHFLLKTKTSFCVLDSIWCYESPSQNIWRLQTPVLGDSSHVWFPVNIKPQHSLSTWTPSSSPATPPTHPLTVLWKHASCPHGNKSNLSFSDSTLLKKTTVS